MRKLLELILALFLATPAVPEGSSSTFNYVAFGDSMASGYGLKGCLPDDMYDDPNAHVTDGVIDGYYGSGLNFYSTDSYPALVKKALEEDYDTVNFGHYTINGMRAYDLDVLLNSYDVDTDPRCDDYFRKLFGTTSEGWLADINAEIEGVQEGGRDLIAEMKDAIANADLITYDLGLNDISSYLINSLMDITNDFVNLDNDVRNVFGNNEFYNIVKGSVEFIVEKYFDSYVPDGLVDVVDGIADTLAYSFVGFTNAFDNTMKTIYAANPDVEVVVVGIQNPVKGFKLDLLGYELPLGDIYGVVVDLVNAYTAYVSPYAGKYYYANANDGAAENFVDQILAWDGTVATLNSLSSLGDCLSTYESKLQIEENVKNTVITNFYAQPIGSADIKAAVQEANSLEDTDVPTFNQTVAYLKDHKADKASYETTMNKLIKDKDDSCEAMYFVFAKALNIAFAHKTVSLAPVMVPNSVTSLLSDLATLGANTAQQVITGYSTLENASDDINVVLASIVTPDNKDALFTASLMLGNNFLVHPTVAGHASLAANVVASFEAKESKRMEDAKSLIDYVPDITQADVNRALVNFANRIIAIANRDHAAIEQSRDEYHALINMVKNFIAEATPYVEAAGILLAEIDAVLERVGMMDDIRDVVSTALTPIRNELSELISKVEEAMTIGTLLSLLTLAELRDSSPVMAVAVNSLVNFVERLADMLPAVVDAVESSFEFAITHFDLVADIAFDAGVAYIIGVKDTIDAVIYTIKSIGRFAVMTKEFLVHIHDINIAIAKAVAHEVKENIEYIAYVAGRIISIPAVREILDLLLGVDTLAQRVEDFKKVIDVASKINAEFYSRYSSTVNELTAIIMKSAAAIGITDLAILSEVDDFARAVAEAVGQQIFLRYMFYYGQMRDLLHDVTETTIEQLYRLAIEASDDVIEIEELLAGSIVEVFAMFTMGVYNLNVDIVETTGEMIYTFVKRVTTDSAVVQDAADEALVKIMNAIFVELSKTPKINFVMKYEEVVEAREDFVDHVEDAVEDIKDEAAESGSNIADAWYRLLHSLGLA